MATRDPQAPPVVAPIGGHPPGDDPSPSRAARVWQFPLLLLSLGLFGYAGYRFIDPKPGPTVDQRLETAVVALRTGGTDAAADVLRGVLAGDPQKLTPDQRAKARLYLARSIGDAQRVKKQDLPANHLQVIELLRAAEKDGLKPDADTLRRLAESYEAVGKPADALAAYKRAISADAGVSPDVRRKVIDLLAKQDAPAEVEAELKAYLADGRLSAGERSWAIGERSRLLADRHQFGPARDLLLEAIEAQNASAHPDPRLLGQFHYRLGYCHWKLGDDAEAERFLRLARQQFAGADPQDADAALLLGRILLKRGRFAEAASFFQNVITDYPDAAAAVPARLGRGLCRVGLTQDDAGRDDLAGAVGDIKAKPARAAHAREAVAAMRQAGQTLSDRGNLGGALELLALEQDLGEHLKQPPTAEFFARLSGVYERQAGQLGSPAAGGPAAAAAGDDVAQAKRWRAWREALTRSADAAVAQSRGLTVEDDAGYGEALWRGIDLYDRAGALPQAIDALELFVAERPNDPLAPDAMLRLGKAYHAAGRFDKAIATYQRNQFRYGATLAAQRSGVPLAKAYAATGPAAYPKAEAALRATLESPLITPEAEEFREALFELAQLHYRTGRFEDAVQRLTELTDRYPRDERAAQVAFLMADSYRKSAQLLAADGAKPPADDPMAAARQVAARAEAAAARQDRLFKARRLYDRAVELYRAAGPGEAAGEAATATAAAAVPDLDKLYLKLAYFYRADCAYDAGRFAEAVGLYDQAALKYRDDPSALTAYVQIVNAYAALGRRDEARAANERAQWLLKRMPPDAFREARLTMPQKSWEDWMAWSKSAGLW